MLSSQMVSILNKVMHTELTLSLRQAISQLLNLNKTLSTLNAATHLPLRTLFNTRVMRTKWATTSTALDSKCTERTRSIRTQTSLRVRWTCQILHPPLTLKRKLASTVVQLHLYPTEFNQRLWIMVALELMRSQWALPIRMMSSTIW